jgi:hypothetical protein
MVNYIGKANAARQARVSGTTLFQVAVDYLNDATQWYRIAQLNGLIDPWIYAIETLQLPASLPSTAQGNGGILGAQTPTNIAALISASTSTGATVPAPIVAPTQTMSISPADFATFLSSLPTVLPTTPGTAWNDGGIISMTPTTAVAPPPIPTGVTQPSVTITAFLASLPTALPASPGIVWNNGGIISVS